MSGKEDVRPKSRRRPVLLFVHLIVVDAMDLPFFDALFAPYIVREMVRIGKERNVGGEIEPLRVRGSKGSTPQQPNKFAC